MCLSRSRDKFDSRVCACVSVSLDPKSATQRAHGLPAVNVQRQTGVSGYGEGSGANVKNKNLLSMVSVRRREYRLYAEPGRITHLRRYTYSL